MSAPTSYSYQWLRNGVAIPGATNSTYTLLNADVGTLIGARVTGRNSAGLGTADAVQVGPIIAQGPISSAGVFDSTGLLVRTLWSAETNHPDVDNPALAWDGALDDGSVAPSGNYTIKVVRNNIIYNWDIANGAIGNSSDGPWTGNLNVWNPGTGPYQFAITTAGQIWTTLGYNEKFANLVVSSRANIQSMSYFTGSGFSLRTVINSQRNIVTDDTYVYGVIWVGGASGTGVYAVDIAGNALVDFGLGSISSFPVMGFDNTASQFIAGLSVQRVGSYLFIARPDANAVLTLDKTVGTTLHSFALNNATNLACNPTNATEIWAVSDGQTIINKLAIDGAGNLSATGVTITTDRIVAMDISPDGTRLLVARGYTGNLGINQVVAYHTLDGSSDLAWGNSGTFGLLGGYSSDTYGGPANTTVVSNTTFQFAEMSSFGGGSAAFVSYDPLDGSFWIGDQGCYRALHFSSGNNPAYIEALYWRGGFYACFGCMNDPTKVSANWNVYTCDLSKSLQYGNGSWALTNNLGGDFSALYDPYIGMRPFIKGSNGRYYGGMSGGATRYIFEIPPAGQIRFTMTGMIPTQIDNNTYVDHSFNLWVRDDIVPDGLTSCTIRRNLFTGFNGSNDPTWASPPTPSAAWPVYLTFTPPASFPETGGDSNFLWPEEVLSNGVIPIFDPSQSNHNHLAGIDAATGQVKFSTMPPTPSNYGETSNLYLFPEAPFFDIRPIRPGGQLFATAGENHFFTQFRGEQTMGGQTNVFSHWHETGLLLNRFGTPAPIFGMVSETNPTGNTPPGGSTNYKGMPGLTGNAAWGGAEKDSSTGIWYVYEGDEWYQGGVTRWSVHDVNTISVDQFPISWNAADYPANVDPTDLLYGLAYNSTVVDGVAGWHRSPINDIPGPGDRFFCKTNINNCNRVSPSLSIYFDMPVAGVTGQTYRTIPRVLAGNWQIDAVTAIFPSDLPQLYMYTEVIDSAGNVLVRIWQDYNGVAFVETLLVNGSPITPYVPFLDSEAVAQGRTPLTIAGNVSTGMITVTWSDNNYTITVPPLDPGANIAAPAKFQYNYHQNVGAPISLAIALFSLHYTES